MLLKFLAFLAAALPIILFVRSLLFRRPNKISEATREFRRQVDIAVWIFIGAVSVLAVIALGKLAWTWFGSP